MSSALAVAQTKVGRSQRASSYQKAVNGMNVEALSEDNKDEILDFLSQRPIHTVCMAGYIRDHGVVSDLNRGTFYGCRDEEGSLEGVALIGHAILLETQSEEALKAFAQLRGMTDQLLSCVRRHLLTSMRFLTSMQKWSYPNPELTRARKIRPAFGSAWLSASNRVEFGYGPVTAS